MVSIEFLLTSLVVVLIPGTGVLFTVATGLFQGKRASVFAAVGCTLGIIPSLLASVFGLAAIFHTSALAFQIVKYVGAAYLLFLAWQIWRSSTPLSVQEEQTDNRLSGLVLKGFLLNILNPKLSIFFLAFLPQFIPAATDSALLNMLTLGGVFMLMTLAVFLVYGFLSSVFSAFIVQSQRASIVMQKAFSASFAALGVKLALTERV
ncbi:LysE family translocator [Reinekea blandensis]|uniref:Putative threonine efflux protein n=1 Tax=Reinekea blandensis MED297 TaxID=314283 RepID=A4BB96_9GAMM|nr:LysE family translocator [Reinekea blandensis]EAR10709.1 putative threonine efflux protein [Reinekea sp. MED297] [Reinekea blandensis MED297]